jgi:hypothetical protein
VWSTVSLYVHNKQFKQFERQCQHIINSNKSLKHQTFCHKKWLAWISSQQLAKITQFRWASKHIFQTLVIQRTPSSLKRNIPSCAGTAYTVTNVNTVWNTRNITFPNHNSWGWGKKKDMNPYSKTYQTNFPISVLNLPKQLICLIPMHK